MEKSISIYSELHHTAHALYNHITSLSTPIRHLYLEPLDFRHPQKTSWWLVPSRYTPIYRFSKLFLHYIPGCLPGIISGFSFERGLGGQLQGLVDKTLLMGSDWYWRRFLNDIAAGKVSSIIQSIQNHSGRDIYLLVESYQFDRLSRRKLETNHPDDVVVYRLNSLEDMSLYEPGAQQLQVYNSMTRCYDLVINIEMLPESAWIWFRFTFGTIILEKHVADRQVDVPSLWDEILRPWMPLVG
jgi:hypothetical protein